MAGDGLIPFAKNFWTSTMIRLFVGLPLPEDHRRQLSLMSHGIEGARWVAPENLHITLRFIGEVDEDVAEDLAQALDAVTARPFELSVETLGTFGHPTHALWAGITDRSAGELAGLQANIESALVRAGLEPEHRKFVPHVTLARFRKVNMGRVARLLEGSGDLKLAPFAVHGFSLFRSHLRPEGAQYEQVVDYTF